MSSSEDEVFAGDKYQQNLPSIFVSYRWNETKEDVRGVANALKSTKKYQVWIDTVEMFGDKNERMEEGIRRADVVLIFFSEDYQKSRDCRKEAESADRNGKSIVFVKMQRARCAFESWFAPIIGSSIFVDFYKFQNPAEEIEKHIDRLLTRHQSSNGNSSNAQDASTGTQFSNNNNNRRNHFVTVKVPKFTKYQKRSDESKICEAFLKLSQISEEGALVICGGGGTGKTTLISQLIHNQSDFLRSECGINVALWLNCFKWTGDAFDEGELTRAVIDLAEKASDFSGFRSLSEVCEYFERQRERVLLIVDDVFNVKILETLQENCPVFACLAVTRDVDQLTSARHGLVSETYRLHELDDEEIISMFENAYRLKAKLSREQFENLARQCSGLPIVVSLIAARFQDCETSRDFCAEYELVMEEVKVKDLKISGPYGTVSKLFEFSIEQLDENFRKMYYAFLLFDPVEPVDVEDLAILWNCPNPHRALVRCRQLAKKSLVRPVATGSGNNKQSDLFLVHQILHEAAVDNATKTHRIASNLPDLREEILVRFSERGEKEQEIAFEIIVKCAQNQRRHLLETIFRNVNPQFVAKIGKMTSPSLTNSQSFFHFLYNTDWPDNGPDKLNGANHSIRLLRQFFGFLLKSNEKLAKNLRTNFGDLLSEPDSSGINCLLLQLFREEPRISRHKFDRRKLTDFLTPIDGTYKKYKQLEWFFDAQKESENEPGASTERTGQLFMASARGEVESVQKICKNSIGLVRLRNSAEETPMIAAALMGHFEVVKFLYDLDPSDEHVNAVDWRDKSAFMVACHFGQLEIVKFLYEKSSKKADLLASRDKKNRTCLILAAMNGALEIIEFLVGENFSLVNDSEKAGKTALIQAARFGHLNTVKFLMEKCHRVHDKEVDLSGTTALMWSAINGRLETVEFFVTKFNVEINQRDSRGATALMHAARHGHIDVVQFLWSRDKNEAVEGRQNDGKTALILAADRNEVEILKLFCEKVLGEKRVDARFYCDKSGQTALMIAARQGLFEIVTLLCEGDSSVKAQIVAGVKMRNKSGRDALKLAIESRHSDVEQFLRLNFYTDDEKMLSQNNDRKKK